MLEIVKLYLLRHKNNVNKVLHIMGIPLVLVGLFQLLTAKWKTGLLLFFFGYLIQIIGHYFFDKNEPGERILIRKIVKTLTKAKND